MIESGLPKDWRELQDKAAQILSESGFEAHTDREILLARGTVCVDVLARAPFAAPSTIYICECKHWQSAVPRNIVHAFRTVVIDARRIVDLSYRRVVFRAAHMKLRSIQMSI
jgi:restriction system protein